MAYCPLIWSLECFDLDIILAFRPSFLSAGENLPIVPWGLLGVILTLPQVLHHRRRSLPILHSSEQAYLQQGSCHGNTEGTGKISSKEGLRGNCA